MTAATIQIDAEEGDDKCTHTDGCPKGDALHTFLILFQLEF